MQAGQATLPSYLEQRLRQRMPVELGAVPQTTAVVAFGDRGAIKRVWEAAIKLVLRDGLVPAVWIADQPIAGAGFGLPVVVWARQLSTRSMECLVSFLQCPPADPQAGDFHGPPSDLPHNRDPLGCADGHLLHSARARRGEIYSRSSGSSATNCRYSWTV